MVHTKRHIRPSLTVDVVIIAPGRGTPRILLIKRKKGPFQGFWAIPGGFVEPYEPLEIAALRELKEETGATPAHLEQLHTFGDPDRDPRGWTVSVAYVALLAPEDTASWQIEAGSDASDVGWFAIDALPPLAFDHKEILAHAARYMADKKLSPTRKDGLPPSRE